MLVVYILRSLLMVEGKKFSKLGQKPKEKKSERN
jgi:hypothetical protein